MKDLLQQLHVVKQRYERHEVWIRHHFTLSTSCNLQTTDPFYVKKDENLSLRVPKFKGSDMTHKCSWMELNPQWQTEILTCMERLHEKESAKNQLYSGKLKKKRRLSTKIYYSVQY